MSTLRFNPTWCMRIIALTAVLAGLRLETAMAQPNDDGASPVFIALSGTTLYGTAFSGGANDDGTAWSLDTGTGAFTNLHDFSEVADGSSPNSIAVSGTTLYGTARLGGANDNDGTAWSLDTGTGAFTNLHDFSGDTDGRFPNAVALSGTTLYGTAFSGGANGGGTAWSLDTGTGAFTNLHDFSADGSLPNAVALSGTTLFGATAVGGANDVFGDGTAWSLDTGTGAFTNLHDFSGDTDGRFPNAVALSGTTLYGTAQSGGANGGFSGDGTAWSLDTGTGAFTNLHDFSEVADGSSPNSIALSGTTLYGTAQSGGANGDGAAWSLDTGTGAFTNLHDFSGDTDGRFPNAVALSGTTLYGTAQSGGANGSGTIWSLDTSTDTFTNLYDFSAIPEPSAVTLTSVGFLSLLGYRTRRRRETSRRQLPT